MESIIGNRCPFNTDSVRNKIADGLINNILYHNEVIRSRNEQRSYNYEHFGDLMYDPYPSNEYITFQDRVNPPLDEKKKAVKIEKTKKFISVATNIKKWLGFICSRVAHEADMLFAELSNVLNSGSTNTMDLDNVMFSKKFEFNLFRLIAKCVGNNEYLLKKHMNIQLLESEIANKIKERYDLSNPMRTYNKNVADWLGKLLDDYFKLIAVHISLKNWFDRDATVSEKNLPPILWLLAENTEYDETLYDFLSYVVPNTVDEKPETPSENLIQFDMTNLSEVAQSIHNMKLEPPKRGKSKKAEPNKAVVLTASQPVPTQPTLFQPLPVQPTPVQFTQPVQMPVQTPVQFTQPLPVQPTPVQFTQPLQTQPLPVQTPVPLFQPMTAPMLSSNFANSHT